MANAMNSMSQIYPNQPNQGNGFWEKIFGTSGQNISNLDPDQQMALRQTLLQGLQNSNFENIANRAERNFTTRGIPSIAERFTAMGGGGSNRSSAFTGALGSARADLDSQLAALQAQFGQQQLQQGLQPHLEYAQGNPGLFEKIAGPLIDAGLSYATGGWGNLFGSTGGLGGDIGKAWNSFQNKGANPQNASGKARGNYGFSVNPQGKVTGNSPADTSQWSRGSLGGPAASPTNFTNIFSKLGF